MPRIVIGFLATLALVSFRAAAEDPAAEAIEGAWVVTVGESPRERFLIVRGAHTDKNLVAVESAVFGMLDGKGKSVTADWRAEVFGDTIRLSFLTPAASRITTTFKSVDTSVVGEMNTKDGRKLFVRMTRLDAEELAAMRNAAAGFKTARGRKVGVTKDSMISLVYVGAEDCPSCARFIARIGKDGRNLKEISPELSQARFVYVNLWAFRDAVTKDSLPPDMSWLIQPAANGKVPMRKRGTPYFAAVVDRRIVAQGHGVVALETLVAPAIKDALEEKRLAN